MDVWIYKCHKNNHNPFNGTAPCKTQSIWWKALQSIYRWRWCRAVIYLPKWVKRLWLSSFSISCSLFFLRFDFFLRLDYSHFSISFYLSVLITSFSNEWENLSKLYIFMHWTKFSVLEWRWWCVGLTEKAFFLLFFGGKTKLSKSIEKQHQNNMSCAIISVSNSEDRDRA